MHFVNSFGIILGCSEPRPKQVAEDEDQQPEPHDKRKYRNQVDQEVRKAEASIEQHDKPPL
jgi:hypothetical protein